MPTARKTLLSACRRARSTKLLKLVTLGFVWALLVRPETAEIARTFWRLSELVGLQMRSVHTVMFVCHPDDESIFGSDALRSGTHVVVVTDADSDGLGRQRREYLRHAMEKVGASWEMWGFPESNYLGASSCAGWNQSTQDELVSKLKKTLLMFPNLKKIVTHNKFGEYGHIDHRNTHKAVIEGFLQVFSGRIIAPILEVFVPDLNYSDFQDRLATPLRTCSESVVHKLLLDSYEADGGLGNAELFRDLCYQTCSASPANSALLIEDRKGCESMLLDEKHEESCCHHVDDDRGAKENTGEEIAIREPENIDAFWNEFYPKLLGFKTVLDILGWRDYTRRRKELIGIGPRYMQLEPSPRIVTLNDGTLSCSIQDALTKYPQFAQYFDVIIDFGFLGWPTIHLDEHEVEQYTKNVRGLLKPGGLYALKVVAGSNKRIDFQKHFNPHFSTTNFSRFQSGAHIDNHGTRVFFFTTI